MPDPGSYQRGRGDSLNYISVDLYAHWKWRMGKSKAWPLTLKTRWMDGSVTEQNTKCKRAIFWEEGRKSVTNMLSLKCVQLWICCTEFESCLVLNPFSSWVWSDVCPPLFWKVNLASAFHLQWKHIEDEGSSYCEDSRNYCCGRCMSTYIPQLVERLWGWEVEMPGIKQVGAGEQRPLAFPHFM